MWHYIMVITSAVLVFNLFYPNISVSALHASWELYMGNSNSKVFYEIKIHGCLGMYDGKAQQMKKSNSMELK